MKFTGKFQKDCFEWMLSKLEEELIQGNNLGSRFRDIVHRQTHRDYDPTDIWENDPAEELLEKLKKKITLYWSK